MVRKKKKINFFISYTKSDLSWAQWINFCLKKSGYSTLVQFADFEAGQNIIHQMHVALEVSDRVLGILSPDYLKSRYAAVEWMAALHDDPLGEKRKLIFVRIAECELAGVLPNIIYIDLVGLSEKDAEEKLLSEIQRTLRPSSAPELLDSRATGPVFPSRLPHVWHLPLVRKSLFTGRDDLIRRIEDSFASGDSEVVTLTGMGGTGKTRLAIEYCYQQIDNYEVIWWIDASAERLIHQGLRQLAKELSLCNDPESITISKVLELFERSHQKQRGLLVFDSVLTPEIALPNVPASPDWHILATSRNPSWLGSARVIEVFPLPRAASIDFLIARSGDHDQESADTLCEQLGNLPIALEQAGRYIERTACGIKQYSARFEDRRRRSEKFDDDSERAIAAVWSLSIRRLFYENPIAPTLLQALSYFGPHRIPREFFLPGSIELPFRIKIMFSILLAAMRFGNRVFGELEDLERSFNINRFDLQGSLESLRKYGLLEINPDDVALHPLVRSVVRSGVSLKLRPYIIRFSVSLLFAAKKRNTPIDEKTKLWCLHVLDVGRSAEQASIVPKELIPLLVKAADLTAAASDEKKAIVTETLERALRCCRVLHKERNEWEIVCLLKLTTYCREADEYAKSVLYLWEAMDLVDEIKDPSSLVPAIMSEYGQLLLLDYDTYSASKFCEAAISVERKLARGNKMLITLLAEHAEILRVAGEYDNAEAAAMEGLRLARADSDNVHVAQLQYMLGKIQSCKGDAETARRHLKGAFSTIEREFGKESPFLSNISFELKSLEHLEIRHSAARLFQTPRDKESNPFLRESPSFSIRNSLLDIYELSREAALENLTNIAMPALVRSGLTAIEGSRDVALHTALEASDPTEAELGKVLSTLLVPIYNAIAGDPLWAEEGGLFEIFKEEMLTQYSVSFRSRMIYELPEGTDLGAFLDTSPSFEDYISLFESRVPSFFELVPECLINFEKRLLAGELHGERRGIYGVALKCDAGFYLDRLSQLVTSEFPDDHGPGAT